MLTLRSSVVGVVAVLLVSGVACNQAPSDIEALRVQANAGDADAQYNLGVSYENGEGVPQDYVEAHRWYNLTASRASAEDRKQAAEARDAVAKLMTPAQIADA